ncbi:MYPU_1760 family metalloprotease [Mycoplasmopsis fermentans]|uniref:MYPU_1760 family metalloprotease n=1 Tax=Mycoplasmopsis fermentans TaxID=2115 RepID=UPI000F0220F7|nr:hypothetical protein [Mycoplasmopsis fermentans]RMX34850.1 hypothetical protein MFI1_0696 [Mycoplasmopsis fermentans MF-I1]
MILPQNIKRSGSKKRNNALFWTLISLSIFLCFVSLFVAVYLLLNNKNETINKNNNLVKIKIQSKEDKIGLINQDKYIEQYAKSPSSLNNFDNVTNDLKNQFIDLKFNDYILANNTVLKYDTKKHSYKYDKRNWVKNGTFKFENNSWVYIDPINNVKFIDKSYGVDKNKKPRFLLGPYGLALLANYFYSRMTYGPEIKFLDSINVNDFSIITKESAGIYLPTIQRIYLNGAALSEKGAKLSVKVKQILYSLFHEYMHHWAHSYASYGSIEDVKNNKAITIPYRSNLEFSVKSDFWYKKFANQFKELLNYDDTWINSINPWFPGDNSFVPYKLSLNDLWSLSNENDNKKFKEALNKLKSIKDENDKVTFRETKDFDSKYLIADYSINSLPYYYSLVELVPREWQKYAYIPFNDPSNPYNYLYEKIIKSDTIDDLDIIESFYGVTFKDSNNLLTYANSYSIDWSRTMHKAQLEADRNFYSNNIYKSENQQLFYKLFLETMGYGKTIAQVKSKIDVKKLIAGDTDSYSVEIDKNNIFQTIISGYLDNKNIKGFYFTNNKDEKKFVKINYLNAFKFEGKDNLLDTTFTLSPNMVLSDLISKQAAYTSDYFDYRNIKENSPIEFWQDLNNDGAMQDNELIKEYEKDPLPDRYLTSSDAPNELDSTNSYKIEASFISKKQSNKKYGIYFKRREMNVFS